MQPNLYREHRVIAEKITYRFLHGPRRGDVVIVDVEGRDESLVKRVVALPGETVHIRAGEIYIDGELLQEFWIARHGGPDLPPTVVPPMHVFLLGDNRGISRDSRSFGPVRMDQIVGQVRLVYWPLERAGRVE
jgi:signal peptidase I